MALIPISDWLSFNYPSCGIAISKQLSYARCPVIQTFSNLKGLNVTDERWMDWSMTTTTELDRVRSLFRRFGCSAAAAAPQNRADTGIKIIDKVGLEWPAIVMSARPDRIRLPGPTDHRRCTPPFRPCLPTVWYVGQIRRRFRVAENVRNN